MIEKYFYIYNIVMISYHIKSIDYDIILKVWYRDNIISNLIESLVS